MAAAKDAKPKDRRTTTHTILHAFTNYTLLLHHTRLGRVVQATRLTTSQRELLEQLGFPTPAQILSRHLPRAPYPPAWPLAVAAYTRLRNVGLVWSIPDGPNLSAFSESRPSAVQGVALAGAVRSMMGANSVGYCPRLYSRAAPRLSGL
jgi:hypothetical protein